MTKEKFRELARKHLTILENPAMDTNGEFSMEIYGIDKLYNKLFVNSYETTVSKDFLAQIRNDVSDLIALCEWKDIGLSEAYLKMLKKDLEKLNKLLGAKDD